MMVLISISILLPLSFAFKFTLRKLNVMANITIKAAFKGKENER